MTIIITLVAGERGPPITNELVNEVRDQLSAGEPTWLAEGFACDLPSQVDLEHLQTLARNSDASKVLDIFVQPRTNRRKRLLLADMDSTIVTGETLDELAKYAGLKQEISEITAKAMRGELNFESALHARVSMLKGLPEDALQKTWQEVQITTGARELVQTMSANGAHCILISGGFSFFTDRIAKKVGFHEAFANQLLIEEGHLTGLVQQPILDKNAKLTTLEKTILKLNIDRSECIAVGDGANDIPMITAAGIGVAFHAKPLVEKHASAIVRFGDLTTLLYMQGFKKHEFCR
ncbi:MAG: phosphoserine phosphatase SerB [Rhodospirillaceae bacterium]